MRTPDQGDRHYPALLGDIVEYTASRLGMKGGVETALILSRAWDLIDWLPRLDKRTVKALPPLFFVGLSQTLTGCNWFLQPVAAKAIEDTPLPSATAALPTTTPSETPTPVLEITPTIVETSTSQPTETSTATPTLTPLEEAAPTMVPTAASPATETPTETPTVTLTSTPTLTPTLSPSPSRSPTPTPTPEKSTATPRPTESPNVLGTVPDNEIDYTGYRWTDNDLPKGIYRNWFGTQGLIGSAILESGRQIVDEQTKTPLIEMKFKFRNTKTNHIIEATLYRRGNIGEAFVIVNYNGKDFKRALTQIPAGSLIDFFLERPPADDSLQAEAALQDPNIRNMILAEGGAGLETVQVVNQR